MLLLILLFSLVMDAVVVDVNVVLLMLLMLLLLMSVAFDIAVVGDDARLLCSDPTFPTHPFLQVLHVSAGRRPDGVRNSTGLRSANTRTLSLSVKCSTSALTSEHFQTTCDEIVSWAPILK